MIKCKLCGTANSPYSSVCTKCGAAFKANRYNTDTNSNNEIFSDTKAECMPRSIEQRDLFSSGEKYEKMKKGVVLKKIYKQEQALGEVTVLEKPPEPTEVVPIVINRRTSSDIVGKNTGSKSKSSASSNRKIPQRKIEPVDPQLIGSKTQTQRKNLSYDNGRKVELTVSDSEKNIQNNIQKKNKSGSTNTTGSSNTKKQSNNTIDKKVKKKTSYYLESDGTKIYTQKEKVSDNHKSARSSDKNTASPKTQTVSRKPKILSSPNQTVSSIQTSYSQEKAPLTKQAAENRKNNEKNSGLKQPEYVPKQNKNSLDNYKQTAVKNSSAGVSSAGNKNTFSDKHSESVSSEKQASKENYSSPKNTASQVNSNNRKKVHTGKNNVNAASPSRKTKSSASRKSSFIGFTESDVDTNKYIAALSYLGILLIVPLFKAGTSNFCKAHSKQGAAVLLYSIIISLITLATVIGLRMLIPVVFDISSIIYNIIAAVICVLMLILLLIPVFSGIASAFSGEYRSVPIVGKFVNGNGNKKNK